MQIRPDLLAKLDLWCESVSAVTEQLHPDHWPQWVWDVLESFRMGSEYDVG